MLTYHQKQFLEYCISGEYRLVKQILDQHPTWVNLNNTINDTDLHQLVTKGYLLRIPVPSSPECLSGNDGGRMSRIDQFCATPLHRAAYIGHKALAKLLLEKGAKVNKQNFTGHTALHIAAYQCHTEVVELLLKKGATVNIRSCEGKTALHITAAQDDLVATETLTLLLERGAAINMQAHDGKTALEIASDHNRTWTAELLIAKGAEVNLLTWDSERPFGSCMPTSLENVQRLLEKGVKITGQNKPFGRTALHRAACKNHTRVIQLLLEQDVGLLNRQDRDGLTALHVAVASDSTLAVATLLHFQAVIEIPDKHGDSALELAIKKDQQIVCDQLIKAICKNEPNLVPLLASNNQVDKNNFSAEYLKAKHQMNQTQTYWFSFRSCIQKRTAAITCFWQRYLTEKQPSSAQFEKWSQKYLFLGKLPVELQLQVAEHLLKEGQVNPVYVSLLAKSLFPEETRMSNSTAPGTRASY